jgi:hypothetical protein
VTELIPITSSADLLGDPHRAELGDDSCADLCGHHVSERIRRDLTKVAPGTEHARVCGCALRGGEVRALDAALQTEDEHQRPDDGRRADDQDAALAQRLAEESEYAQAVDVADDLAAECPDLAGGGEPFARHCEQFVHLITRICGWVARSVWVKT